MTQLTLDLAAKENTMTLNINEQKVFNSCVRSSDGNGHDFGITRDVKVAGLSAQQVGAYLVILQEKGLLRIEDEHFVSGCTRIVQFTLTACGFEAAGINR
jgi:hypothetical protein